MRWHESQRYENEASGRAEARHLRNASTRWHARRNEDSHLKVAATEARVRRARMTVMRQLLGGGMFAAHLSGEFLDFGEVALHLAPAIPEGVIGTGVEGALERAHAVFEEHDEQFLFDDRGRIVKGQQEREGVGIVRGFGQHTIFIESGDFANALGHQVISVFDHVVAMLELVFGEIDGVALVAGLDHFVALGLPGGLIESREVGGFHHVEKLGGFAIRIEYAEGLQNGDAIGGPFGIFGHRQAYGEESPGGADFVIAFLHVAGLAGGRGGFRVLDFQLLEIFAHAVFRGVVHLPLWMIEAHVARLAGLRRARFFERKRVTGMAGIAGGVAKAHTVFHERGDLLGSLEADLVTAAATLHAFGHSHGLVVNGGHGFHGGPGHGVLALFELLDAGGVTIAASFGSGNERSVRVVEISMVCAMTRVATDAERGVFAELPIADDVGSHPEMTFDALVDGRGRFLRESGFLFSGSGWVGAECEQEKAGQQCRNSRREFHGNLPVVYLGNAGPLLCCPEYETGRRSLDVT